MKVLIAGGGIGGLTAALCCVQKGFDVQVIEQAEAWGEVGAGIQIPPNAMQVFQALGIQNEIAAKAFKPVSIETRMGRSGRRVFAFDLESDGLSRWGAPYFHIHRADYIDGLALALERQDKCTMTFGRRVAHFMTGDRRVEVILDNGKKISGDVLIAADGVHSTIRPKVTMGSQPQFTGHVAWRATVPMDALGDLAPDPTACVWMGGGRHAVTYRIRQGDLANFVGVVEQDTWTSDSWTQKGEKSELVRDFAGWHPVIQTLIQKADPDHIFKWALLDHPPLETWVNDRVALLGDAAHPMLPFVAQGAAMAVEDAWVLAKCLAENSSDIPAALRNYETERKPRATRVQSASRRNQHIYHRGDAISQILAYGPMWIADKFLPGFIPSRLNWLMGNPAASSKN